MESAQHPDSIPSKSLLSSLTQPALIITAVSVGSYYLSWSYFDAFFNRLSLQHQSLDLPPTFYLTGAVQALFWSLLLIAWAVLNSRLPRRGGLEVVISNAILITPFVIALVVSFQGILSPLSWITWAAVAVSLIIFTYFSYRGKYMYDFSERRGFASTLLLATALLWLVVVSARNYGDSYATAFIEGKTSGQITVDFKWKTTPPPELAGKKLLLVLHRDSKYFVITQTTPAPRYTTIYAVNDQEIEMATMISE